MSFFDDQLRLDQIGRLAKRIRNTAHLEAILADIPSPDMRAEVRRLIIPMLEFEVVDNDPEPLPKELIN